MPSAQVQRGMPEGQLTATIGAFKAIVQIAEDKKICDKPAVHAFAPAPPLPVMVQARVYCALQLYS